MIPAEAAEAATPSVALGGLAVAALLGAPLALLAARLTQRRWPAREEVRPPWGAFELVGGVVVYLLAIMLGSVLLVWLYPSAGGEAGSDAAPAPLGAQLALLALALGAVGLAIQVWAERPGGGAALGVPRTRSVRAAVDGVWVWALTYPLIFGLGMIWPWLHELSGGSWAPQAWGDGFEAAGGEDFLIAALFAVLIVPPLEELAFRGFLQPLLVSWLGPLGGVGTTAALFALLHDAGAFLPVLAIGLMLGLLRHRTGRLAACAAAHIVHNGAQVLILALAA